NALLGFQYIHGTMPDPTEASPDSTPGGYSGEEWPSIMDDPEAYAALHPHLVTGEPAGDSSDTKDINVTPKVLPIVAPLHEIGLTPIADLIEPALRVLIEQTGYNRNIPYGQVTPFRIIPIFNPITLTIGLIKAIPEGIEQALGNLGVGAA